ncbi:MAG: DinB family protein [Actinobacteria bacterium]|nr:DinB family protein [Actinomycetota bacterium]
MAGLTPPTFDERTTIIEFMRQQRYVLKVTAFGLTDEQAKAAPTVSALSVGGIIKHVALTERHWMQRIVADREVAGMEAEYETGFTLLDGETLASTLAFYDEVAGQTEDLLVAEADLGRLVPIPTGVPWFPQDEDNWSLRWVLHHVIEETARHAGHADIVRESVDGGSGFKLLADYETAQGNPPSWAAYVDA